MLNGKIIGGYFELELRKGDHYHKDAIRLNTAQNCFEYLLRVRQFTKVYIPYYTCSVILNPINNIGVEYEFYHINDLLEPMSFPKMEPTEGFLYTNYFGLKQTCAERLSDLFGNQLIVDNAQAFYAKPIQNVGTFYSARKFFGVPDGAYLYSEKKLDTNLDQDISCERMSHLLRRVDMGAEAGYREFRTNDDYLCVQEMKRMSRLTEAIMCGIDYETAKQKRRENYVFLAEALRNSNLIHLDLDDEAVPMAYPYLTKDTLLRQKLIENKVFVPTYWPNVKDWVVEGTLERDLTDNLIPIPCDQRYGIEDMNTIVDMVDRCTGIL